MLERCEEDEDDECWLLQEQTDCGGGQTNSSTGPNNLCRTNVTNYTLAWSSTSVGTDQDLDYNEPGWYLSVFFKNPMVKQVLK